MVVKTKSLFLKSLLLSLMIILTFNVVFSTSPTHPLSDITPMDVPLQLDGQPIQSGDSDEIVLNETDTFVIDSDILMGGDIRDYFGSCDAGEAVIHIQEDGSFECMDVLGGEVSDAYVNRSGDSMFGNLTMVDSADIVLEDDSDINMDMGMVTGLRGPSIDRDAVNKLYVDAQVDGATQTLEEVLLEGQEAHSYIDMTGENIINIGDLTGTDIVDQEQISEDSVGLIELDELDVDSRYVEVGGDVMEGDLDFDESFKVSGLLSPVEDRDAAHKAYVDAQADGATQTLEEVLLEGQEAHGQNIDMGGGIIESIGDASTEFTGSGGLNLADSLTILSGGLEVSGNVNLDAGVIDNTELANSDITLNTGTGIVGGDSISLGGSNEISLDTSWTDNRYVEVGGDVMEGDLDFDESFKVSGLLSPVEDRDAAHKAYVDAQIDGSLQDLESVLLEGSEAYSPIDMTGEDILQIGDIETSGDMGITGGNVGIGTTSPSADLEVEGDIMINSGQGTGTDSIEGHRELYAADETFVEDGIKEMTMVFNSEYGKNPSFVNILARGEGTITIDIDGIAERDMDLDGGISELSIDTRGIGDGTYDVEVDITDPGAENDIIEFYYVG